MKRRYFLIAGIFSLIVFTFFSRAIKQGAMKQIDFNTTVRLQDKIPVIQRFKSDELWEDAAFFISPPVSVIVIILISIINFIIQKGWKKKFLTLGIPFLFALMVFAEIYGKNVVHHPSPPFFMIKNPTTIFPTYYINEQFSYPSGHTARATFIGIVVSYVVYQVAKRKKILYGSLAIMSMYVLIIAVGRIYLGHHWLSDIIGGGFIGAGFGILSISFLL